MNKYTHLGQHLYDAWHAPEAVAEREQNRAICNAHFDAIRDKALAKRDAEELRLTEVHRISDTEIVA